MLSCGKVYGIRRADGKVENVNVARLLPLGPDLWTSDALESHLKDADPITLPAHQVPAALRSFSEPTVRRVIFVDSSESSDSTPEALSSTSGVEVQISSIIRFQVLFPLTVIVR